MRAGLLSQPQVIETLNDHFVSTWIIIDNATKLADAGVPFAKTLVSNWEYPVDMMFITPEGKVVSKLNSYKDFKDVHPDVAAPPGKYRLPEGVAAKPNLDVFMEHVSAFLGRG